MESDSEEIELKGKPRSGTLSPCEVSLFDGAIAGTNVMPYSALVLSNKVSVTAKSMSQSRKQDNSVIHYHDDCYGIVEKIFRFQNINTPHCLIIPLVPSVSICTDDVTNANISSHLVTYKPPR